MTETEDMPFLPRKMAAACSYGPTLILSLCLSACAAVKSVPTSDLLRESPKASVGGMAPKPAASPVVKPPQEPVARKEAANPPGTPEETGSDELVPSRDRENSVYFPLGSYSLDHDAEAAIKSHVEKLLSDPRLVVTLIGHTDDLGSKEYNDALCIGRANAVKQALQDLGVAPKQIRLSNRYGYEAASRKRCSTDACRKVLRRVEFSYNNTASSH